MRRIAALLVAGALLFALAPWAAAASRCFGKRPTITGTPETDRIRGTPRDDVISAGDKRDRVTGQDGDDLICAGGGHDLVRGNDGADRISGAAGFDFLVGGEGDDVINARGAIDVLIGDEGNDRLSGGGGREDLLLGGPGDDTYQGGPGDTDIASFERSTAPVTVDLANAAPQATGEGTDQLSQVEGIIGSVFDDVLRGMDVPTAVGDLLIGFEGRDQISGLAGDDVIFGGAGSDDIGTGLEGGSGNDVILGDEADPFFPGSGDDHLLGGEGDDILDGGGNTTGPPNGDFGDGGPHVAGDQCAGLEDAGTTECEKFSRDAAPLARALRVLRRWSLPPR